jgi:uncharacterized protein YceK
MRNYRFESIIGVFILAVLLSGCTTRVADFTIASTKNVSMEQQYQRIGSTEGDDTGWFTPADMKLAVDQALTNAGSSAAYLTNVRVMAGSVIPFQSKFTVTGDAWAPVNSASADNVDGEVYELKKTENGKFLVSEDGSKKVKVFGAR